MVAVMRAISLWQPWASAIPMGLKMFETRGWKTNYRGPLIVHAAKRMTSEQKTFIMANSLPYNLPLGNIVAICELTGIFETEFLTKVISDTERTFGDYAPGRYGWLLENIRPIGPIPFKGGQGFFNVPDETIEGWLP
jgi:activating signal cointegrator 1